jgi:hypothetical protein
MVAASNAQGTTAPAAFFAFVDSDDLNFVHEDAASTVHTRSNIRRFTTMSLRATA